MIYVYISIYKQFILTLLFTFLFVYGMQVREQLAVGGKLFSGR